MYLEVHRGVAASYQEINEKISKLHTCEREGTHEHQIQQSELHDQYLKKKQFRSHAIANSCQTFSAVCKKITFLQWIVNEWQIGCGCKLNQVQLTGGYKYTSFWRQSYCFRGSLGHRKQ